MTRQALELRALASRELVRRLSERKTPVEYRGRTYRSGLELFIREVYSLSFDNFVWGKYLEEVATRMATHDWTMDVSARDHFKSSRLYAEIMRDVFCCSDDTDCHYFSYKQSMSEYHLKKVKQLIRKNPMFRGIADLSPQALSSFTYDNGKAIYTAMPAGLLSFKRGIHAERIYVDDPLRDPENKLAPTVIYKINNIIKTEIFSMVKKGGICRVVGTPQTNSDFFFDEKLRNRFDILVRPAIVDEANKIALFPEWKSYEELCDIRNTVGEKVFDQEYMCKPAYAANSYISREDLMAAVSVTLQPVDKYDGDNDVIAGFDIGKKAHPAHLTIFERTEDEDEKYHYRQLKSKWFDGVEYKEQLEYLKWAIKNYSISKCYYDNTRGEFEGFEEQGLLPEVMEPVVFSMKTNNAMAVSLNTIIREERVKFLNDARQIDQILQVNNELQAIESPLGHGDSFWSNAMALMEEERKEYRVFVV